MTNQTDNFPDLMSDDPFEVVMRGYSRRQVRDYMDRTRNQIRDLEERLARTIDQAEQSRMELAEARRRLAEAPQNPDELGERLSQILKLAQEEAAANKEASEAEAARVRQNAAAEAERLVASAREQADAIRAAAQEEAERRVAEATAAAERLLSQAGAEAEETVGSARTEAEQTLHSARAEAERQLTFARQEADRLLGDARAQADATLTSAQQRAATLDEHTGRRVAYLTDTHTEVVRRLSEIGSVLGDLLHRETAAGPLIDEAAVLPPAPFFPQVQQESAPRDLPEAPAAPPEPEPDAQGAAELADLAEPLAGVHGEAPEADGGPDIPMTVDDQRHEQVTGRIEAGEDTDVDLGRVGRPSGEQEPLHTT